MFSDLFNPPRPKLRPPRYSSDGRIIQESNVRYLPQRPKRLNPPTPDWIWGAVFFCGVTLGLIVRGKISSSPPLEHVLKREPEPVAAASDDYALTKDVLVATVALLNELSQDPTRSTIAGPVPKEVKTRPALALPVVAIKSAVRLRAEPSEGSRIIATVLEGTVLLGTALRDGWMEVSSPLGGKAWVRRDLVRYAMERK